MLTKKRLSMWEGVRSWGEEGRFLLKSESCPTLQKTAGPKVCVFSLLSLFLKAEKENPTELGLFFLGILSGRAGTRWTTTQENQEVQTDSGCPEELFWNKAPPSTGWKSYSNSELVAPDFCQCGSILLLVWFHDTLPALLPGFSVQHLYPIHPRIYAEFK